MLRKKNGCNSWISLYELALCGDVDEIKKALCYVSDNYSGVYFDLVELCKRSTSLSVKSYAAGIMQNQRVKTESVIDDIQGRREVPLTPLELEELVNTTYLSIDDRKGLLLTLKEEYETRFNFGFPKQDLMPVYLSALFLLEKYYEYKCFYEESWKEFDVQERGECWCGYVRCLFYLEDFESVERVLSEGADYIYLNGFLTDSFSVWKERDFLCE